ncbi:DUF3606 domain-containing protein [Bradyrhizobium sp. STM 3557]|uniref:DUF3606 domain-containing protein n=1 Tax=Bradyrhizobium sp. STM 3557 TaxID=578920 RepID=UPI0038901741
MHRPKIQPIRNKLDLNDRIQMRVVTKRLGVSQAELTDLVGRIGNSITALAKEVHLQKARKLSTHEQTPPAAVIASVASDPAVTELSTASETPV